MASVLPFAFLAPPPAGQGAEPDIRRDATVMAVEQAMPSVVNIATETVVEYHDFYDALLRNFYGLPARQQKSISLGSGVIIDEDGYVLTNFHVVRRASRVQVKLWNGKEYEADPCVYTEATDVALLKLRGKPGEKFKAIKFAADDDLLLGETVLAMGNPFGLGGSVTRGILSSKNRRPSTGNEPLDYEDWLQTDAAINPGNSGGPLVNLRGELIGLNVAVYREQDGSRGMGVGFSIPVKQVSSALSKFFTPEVTDSLWFGAQVKGAHGPLVVSAVQPGGPAQLAGLREGDRVMQVNGEVPKSLITFNQMVTASGSNPVQLTVATGAERRTISLRMVPFDKLIEQKLGLTLAEPTAQAAAQMGVRAGDSMMLAEVERGSPAAKTGLQRGYFLTGIDGQQARGLSVTGRLIAGKKKGDSVRLSLIVPQRVSANYVELRPAEVDLPVR